MCPNMWQEAASTCLFCPVVPTSLLSGPGHTDPILPFASTASLPTCSQLCVLPTGHPRGEQAHHRGRGGRHAQIPSPPVQTGPGQGTAVSTSLLWARQWGLSTGSSGGGGAGGRDTWAGGEEGTHRGVTQARSAQYRAGPTVSTR